MPSSQDALTEPLATAFAHHQAERFAEAEARYRQLLTSAPDNVVVMQLLAVLSLQTGQGDSALALLRRAVEVDPNLVAAHVSLGIVLEERGDLSGAAAQYRQTTVLRPENGEANLHLARVLIAQGDAPGRPN